MPTTLDQVRGRTTSWAAAQNRSAPDRDRHVPAEVPDNNTTTIFHPRQRVAQIIPSKIENVPDHANPVQGIYTQRRLDASTPGVSQNPRLSLGHPIYGLPERLVANLGSMGIRIIYPWQAACLAGEGLLQGERNLVYRAPTGGGKSLVADMLMLRRVLAKRKAILVLPYVALVQEKVRWLQRAVEGVDRPVDVDEDGEVLGGLREHSQIRVVPFHGGSRSRETWMDADIAVCTIEKANSLVNAAIERASLDDLGIAVLDELHMVDDPSRGYLLELLATKLLCLDAGPGVQIVGMSATISDARLLADWLGGRFYCSNYKPVPIEEYLVHDNKIFPAPEAGTAAAQTRRLTQVPEFTLSRGPCRTIAPSAHRELRPATMNAVVALALETVQSGHGALVFCGSRADSEATAALIARAMPPPTDASMEARQSALANLQLTPAIDEALERLIPQGVAFHHAGLTSEERAEVAAAYDSGALRVITATCGLAAGINLPARRVILKGVRMGREVVGPSLLRQMRGRAGRKGRDEVGETYVCCAKEDVKEVTALLEAETPPITSGLESDRRGLHRALLEVVAIRLATRTWALKEYVGRTLLFHTTRRDKLVNLVEEALADLVADGLIEHGKSSPVEPSSSPPPATAVSILGTPGATAASGYDHPYAISTLCTQRPIPSTDSNDEPAWTATPLGAATVAAGLAPADGVFLHTELQRAIPAFALDTHLHALYLLAPTASLPTSSSSGPLPTAEIYWPAFRDGLARLEPADPRVLEHIGINPGLVARFANKYATPGHPLATSTPQEVHTARIYARFYAALQLHELCSAAHAPPDPAARRAADPDALVAARYGLARGQFQSAQLTAAACAGATVTFAQRLGPAFALLAAALAHVAERVRAGGAGRELLALRRLPGVGDATAHALYDAGLRDWARVAEAPCAAVVGALMRVQVGRGRGRSARGGDEARVRRRIEERAEVVQKVAGRWAEAERVLAVEEDV